MITIAWISSNHEQNTYYTEISFREIKQRRRKKDPTNTGEKINYQSDEKWWVVDSFFLCIWCKPIVHMAFHHERKCFICTEAKIKTYSTLREDHHWETIPQKSNANKQLQKQQAYRDVISCCFFFRRKNHIQQKENQRITQHNTTFLTNVTASQQK